MHLPDHEAWLLLLASLAALAAGPILDRAAGRRPHALAFGDGFVLAAVLALLASHVVPEAAGTLGIWVLLPLGIGLALPGWLARAEHAGARSVTVAALLGLTVHAGLDGLALARSAGPSAQHALGLAVALHRLPVSVATWWMVRSAHGRRAAAGVLGVVGLATLLGFAAGSTALPEGGALPAAVQALVAGSLVHVAAHRTAGPGRPAPRVEALGFLAGLALVALGIEGRHDHAVGEVAAGLLDALGRIAPALLLAWAGHALGLHRPILGRGGLEGPLAAIWLLGPLRGGLVTALHLALGDRSRAEAADATPAPRSTPWTRLAGAAEQGAAWWLLGLAALSSAPELAGVGPLPPWTLVVGAALGAIVRVPAGPAVALASAWVVAGGPLGPAVAFAVAAPTGAGADGPTRVRARPLAPLLAPALGIAAGLLAPLLPALGLPRVPGPIESGAALTVAACWATVAILRGPRALLAPLLGGPGHRAAEGPASASAEGATVGLGGELAPPGLEPTGPSDAP